MLDATPVEADKARERPHDEPSIRVSEPVAASALHPSTSPRATPEVTPVVAHASPTTNEAAALPAEDRISPWRAPIERITEVAAETRPTLQAPKSTSRWQDDKPDTKPGDSTSVVQVTIGRLEVRAPEAPRRPAAKPARAAPRLSLQDYLQRRNEGRAR